MGFRFKQVRYYRCNRDFTQPSYDVLFAEETKPGLEGFEKGQETGAANNDRCIHRSFS